MALGVTPLSWAQWLAKALDLPFTCYAVNGAIAADVLRDAAAARARHYDLVALYAGVNDVRSPDFDAAAYERDLDAVAAGLAARATAAAHAHAARRPRPPELGAQAGRGQRRGAPRRRAPRRGASPSLSDFGGWTLVLPDIVHPTALGQLEIADRAARALGAPPLPSALRPDAAGTTRATRRAHARALARDLVRRGARARPPPVSGRLAPRLAGTAGPGSARPRRHARSPRGLQLAPGAQLVLGDGCRIGEHTRIVVQGGRVEIGAGAVLGERCTLVAHAGVTIGAGARLEEGAVVVDFDHVFDDVELPIRAQPLAAATVAIGAARGSAWAPACCAA